MKSFTYVLFALTVVAVPATLWVFRPVPPTSGTSATFVPSETKKSSDRPRVAIAPNTSRPEVIEPILVLPEIEVAPLPQPMLVPDLDVAIGRSGDFANADINIGPQTPRPEVIRESRPWMPYAPEDRELADTRRLEWVKLSVRDSQAVPHLSDFEETQEPPLLDTKE